jgi:SAM-dependent methyltransferase
MHTPSEQPFNFEFAALNEAKNYRAALIKEFSPVLKGRVLEIGAGIGQITALVSQTPGVSQVVGVEPEAQFIPGFRAALPKIPLVQGTADSIHPETHWDAIICVNVLEHIEADDRELQNYHRLLKAQRGHLCLFVPARQEIYAPIDKDFGHFRRYQRPELKRKLLAAGFEIVCLNYFNLAGYFAWWANFCVLRRRTFDIASVHFFDRVIFPLVFGWESNFVRPPIGQSLIAIAKAG